MKNERTPVTIVKLIYGEADSLQNFALGTLKFDVLDEVAVVAIRDRVAVLQRLADELEATSARQEGDDHA